MEKKRLSVPAGTGAVLMPSEEMTSSYMGLTREQKLEILTHSLVNGLQQGVLLRDERENRE